MGLAETLQRAAGTVSKQFGGAATLRKYSSTYDPATGTTTSTTTDHTVYVTYEDYSDHLVDGTAIQTTDRKALFSAGDLPAGVAPAQNDELIEGGTTMTVVRVRPAEVQGSAVTYQLQVRA
jgi:hypothetical protein